MEKEEYAYYVNLCTNINRNLNYPLGKGRGKSKKNIDFIIQQAVERCGYTDFYAIQNTNDNQWALRNEIMGNIQLFLEPIKQ